MSYRETEPAASNIAFVFIHHMRQSSGIRAGFRQSSRHFHDFSRSETYTRLVFCFLPRS